MERCTENFSFLPIYHGEFTDVHTYIHVHIVVPNAFQDIPRSLGGEEKEEEGEEERGAKS